MQTTTSKWSIGIAVIAAVAAGIGIGWMICDQPREGPAPQNRLVLHRGSTLLAYYGGEYREIKSAETFYGFGWLDSRRVFVAYQDRSDGGAVATAEVIDLETRRAFQLVKVGAAGESNFDVNARTGQVVFSDPGGAKVMSIDKNAMSGLSVEIDGSVGCTGVFWIDDMTIGCMMRSAKDNAVFKRFPLGGK